jgi:microcystin-dependent protein
MPYLVTKTDGTILTTVQDGTIDYTTALALPGPNYVGYGSELNENLVHLLENFAGNTTPSGISVEGQLYFDKGNQILKVFTTQGYVPVSGVTNSGIQPALSKDGDIWFNTITNQMSIWDNGQFKPIGPIYTKAQGVSGALPVSIDDATTSGLTHNIIKIQFGKTVFATLSKDDSFVPSGFDPGFPTINPGITLNSNISRPSMNTNVVGNLTGNVVATTVTTGRLIGNVVASTLSGALTGNVVGNLTGNTAGVHTGNVVASSVQATTVSTLNAQITGGAVSGLATMSATSVQATNFSSGNVLITNGAATLNTLTANTAQLTNVTSGNATINGGNVNSLITLSAAQSTLTNLLSTTAQITNFSSGNVQIAGGSLAVTNSTVENETATNFSSGNAQITGGSVTNLTTLTATAGTVAVLTAANLQAASGNVSGITGANNAFVKTDLQSSTATTANVLTNSTAIATTAFVHNVMPSGAIIMFAGATIPYGWHICDGTNGTPDLRDRFIAAAGRNYAVGTTGGNTSVTLSATQMPAHSHSINPITATTGGAGAHNHTATTSVAVSDPGHTHNYTTPLTLRAGGGNNMAGGLNADSGTGTTQTATTGISASGTTVLTPVDVHTHTVALSGSTASAGGTSAVDITPAYYALYFIQKVI